MEKINKDKIISVSVIGLTVDDYYFYVKGRKRTWIDILTLNFPAKEGWHSNYGYIGIDIPDNHVLIGEFLYIKPRVIIRMIDDCSKTKYFDTSKEAQMFAESITKDSKWIKISE